MSARCWIWRSYRLRSTPGSTPPDRRTSGGPEHLPGPSSFWMKVLRGASQCVTKVTNGPVTQQGDPVVSITMRVRDKGDRGVVQSVVMFLGVSVLSGALAAGLAIPFAGLAGFSTEKTSETLQDLPQQFDEVPLKQKS